MYRLFIRIFLASDTEGELDATVEREIAVPFVPQKRMRLNFSDDDEWPVDIVLDKVVWRVPNNRFEFEMSEVGENADTVIALLNEWTGVGFTVVACTNERILAAYSPRHPESNGHGG